MTGMTNVTKLASEPSGQEFLVFTLGDEEYGIDILKVQEIRGYDQVTRIANTPAFIKGVTNLRGVIVPIVDLRIKFSQVDVDYNDNTVVIVLNLGQRVVGIVVADLQAKMKKLQSMKAGSDRTKLEKDVMAQRQTFAQKAQAFEQDRARRSNEERGKLVTRIQTAVKSVANSQDIDLVVDANAVAYNSSDVKDITADVLKQVK